MGATPRRWSAKERLAAAVACSVLLHLCLLGVAVLAKRFAPVVIVKKGEPLFVELPDPEEFAPRGNPALPVRPEPPARPKPMKAESRARRAAPKAEVPPTPLAPAPAPSAPKATPPPAPEPTVVAKAPPSPEPEGLRPAPPTPTKEAAKPEPAAPTQEEPRSNGGRELHAALPPSPQREPGGGGGLRGGRGGIEGDPIPLDTKDPRYTDYFEKIRRQIRANWIYPREAGERGIGGQLVIEFIIAKDGHLSAIELRRTSGVEILDRFALNAVKLAQPFPPLPDQIAKVALPIAGIFTYQILDPGLLNYFLR